MVDKNRGLVSNFSWLFHSRFIYLMADFLRVCDEWWTQDHSTIYQFNYSPLNFMLGWLFICFPLTSSEFLMIDLIHASIIYPPLFLDFLMSVRIKSMYLFFNFLGLSDDRSIEKCLCLFSSSFLWKGRRAPWNGAHPPPRKVPLSSLTYPEFLTIGQVRIYPFPC